MSAVATSTRSWAADMKIATSDQATKQRVIDSLKTELSRLTTPDDSVVQLFNIYDLAVQPEKIQYGKELVETSRRAGKTDVAFDVIRNIANNNMRDQEVLDQMLQLAESYPQSKDRDNTVTFIRILDNSTKVKDARTPEEKIARIQQLVKEASINPPKNAEDHIVMLHALCLYLSELAEGELLADYLHRLGEMIENEEANNDHPNHALKNAYYVWASMIYTKVGQHTLAIEACRNLLDEIDLLDRRNKEIGRRYRCYDAHRYIVYTRLLENYDALDPSDVEKYYSEAMRLAKSAPRAAATYESAPLPSIFYAFYQKNYRKAFELIESCKDNPYLDSRKLMIMKMYIGAATAIGNHDALLKAYPEYAKLLEVELDTRQKERYRELQVLYDVNEIKLENLRLKEQQHLARKRLWQTITLICVVVIAILGIFTFFLLRLSRRKARMAAKLKITNKNLRNESRVLKETRDELEAARDMAARADRLKTDFINNMSHEVKVPLQAISEYSQMILENTDDERKKYMSTFVDRLMLNCELVNTIINDVLQLAELHNSTLKIKEMPHSLLPICETAADAIRNRLAPGVKLKVTAREGDFIISTDRHRLIQILTNLLSNAAKFTKDGEITLDLSTSKDGSQAVFTVTDTGCGIDPRNKELIFERFCKIDNSVPGAGIGLTISRMIATLMGGSLILDTAYNGGARFILTLPDHS